MKAGGESMLCQADEKTEWIEVLPEHFVRCRKEVGHEKPCIYIGRKLVIFLLSIFLLP